MWRSAEAWACRHTIEPPIYILATSKMIVTNEFCALFATCTVGPLSELLGPRGLGDADVSVEGKISCNDQ